MQPRIITATSFMNGSPHFVTWTVEGCTWTGNSTYPTNEPPFDFEKVCGIVDANGVFHSISCSGIYLDGRRLKSVRIERDPTWLMKETSPDWEAQSHA